jgi:hypothetical protein
MGVASGAVSAASDTLIVAGVEPSERPEAAPVITEVQRDAQWRDNALKGVEEPYPESLKFLNSQGNWFTPFSHPGMTGPYDIRDWH